MERGPRGAGLACFLLIAGIGLEIGRGAAGEDTKSWGPLPLNGSNMLEEVQNSSKTIAPDEEFPFPLSPEPVFFRSTITQSQDLLQTGSYANSIVPNSNTDVLVDQVIQDSTFHFQWTTSMASSHESSNSVVSDASPGLSSTVLYSSITRETGQSLVFLESSMNNPAFISPEHIVATSAVIAREASSYGEHLSVSSSLEECSSIFWTDTLSQSDIIEDTLGGSNAQPTTSLDAPVIQQTSKPIETISRDANFLTSGNALQSIFSIWQSSTKVITPSLYMSLSTIPLDSDGIDLSSSPLVTSGDKSLTAISSPTSNLAHEILDLSLNVASSKLQSGEQLESISIKPSAFGGDKFLTSMVPDLEVVEESTHEIFVSVFPSVPVTSLSSWQLESSVAPMDFSSLLDTSFMETPSSTLLQSLSREPEPYDLSVLGNTMAKSTFMDFSSLLDTSFMETPSSTLRQSLSRELEPYDLSVSGNTMAKSTFMDFSSLLDTRFMETPSSTLLQSLSREPEPYDLSVLGNTMAKSTFMDSTFYATDSLVLESPLASTADTYRTLTTLDQSLFETVNAIKDTASTNTESVMYFSETLFPLEESETFSYVFSSHRPVVSLLEPSSTLPSFSEEMPTSLFPMEFSEPSSIFSQGSSAVISTPELFFSSSALESSSLSTVDTMDFAPWQTSTPYLIASPTPFSISGGGENSSSVFSESSELWEATSSLQLESEFLYTSSFNGAISTLLPLSPVSDADTVVQSLYTSTFDYYTSSDLDTESLQTSLVTTFYLSSWMSMSVFDGNTVVTPESPLQTHELSVTPTINLSPTLSELSSLLESFGDMSILSSTTTLPLLSTESIQSTPSLLDTISDMPTLSIETTFILPPSLTVPSNLSMPYTVSEIPSTSYLLPTLSEAPTLTMSYTSDIPATLLLPTTWSEQLSLSILETSSYMSILPTTSLLTPSVQPPFTLSDISTTLLLSPTLNIETSLNVPDTSIFIETIPSSFVAPPTTSAPSILSMSFTATDISTISIPATPQVSPTMFVPPIVTVSSISSILTTLSISSAISLYPSTSLPINPGAPHTSSIILSPTRSSAATVAPTASTPNPPANTEVPSTVETVATEATTYTSPSPGPTKSPSTSVHPFTSPGPTKSPSTSVHPFTSPGPTKTPTSVHPFTSPAVFTTSAHLTTTRPPLVCDVSNPEPYLVKAVLARGASIDSVTESIKELLSKHFNHSVELEVYTLDPGFSFMATSGPYVYTSIAVENILSYSSLFMGLSLSILSLETANMGLDQRFQIQTVLQFVPQSVDIRLCTFSEQIQKGLSLAMYEVRKWRQESDNFTVQILNITSASRGAVWKAPVTVSYGVRDRSGFLNGSDVSDQLRNLSLVEFSFFLGFPVKQIAEPSLYPQLDVSPLLKDSWLRTVLLGVVEQQLRGETFQADIERKLAQLISEASSQMRRWKRASFAGSRTVQVVNVSRLDGSEDPVQLVYFVEDQFGKRLPAADVSSLINEVNVQRAAIILGYRVQGIVAQPLNQAQEADRQAQNLWIIVGVAVPVLVVTVIIVILYWKLCRTDKLDFQPDTMSNLQQRQKLQAPSVKGFDFAKQHLGQHSKEDVLVVHEPPPPILHGPLKDSTPSENGDFPTPKSKGSSKPPKVGRHRGRVTPSDAGSVASDGSSGKESAEETSPRPSAPPREAKVRSSAIGELPMFSSGTEQHSSASIFEHVDRISRSSEAGRRLPSKIQLIAMQPIAAPPMHGLSVAEREAEVNKINREIQTTLRHKSEIEHHRNKIRLRAKRKGHYEFPLADMVGITDTKERQRMYRKAQMQFDKILDPVSGMPTVFIEQRKSSRSRRSPKQRRRQQGSGSPPDADRDRLITTDSDGTYKRPPGVSNSAYVSDPDLPSDDPTPVADLGKYSSSPHRVPPPAQYVPPQPSIEEVRQTMQSLLDDAFALVAPSSQGVTVPVAGQAATSEQQPADSTSAHGGRGTKPWVYPPQQPSQRFPEYGIPPATAPSHLTRSPGFSSGFLPPAEVVPTESQQTEASYPARGLFPEDVSSLARPRPLGSTAGPAQIHHLTQVGIASRMGVPSTDLPSHRGGQQPALTPSWSSYYLQEETQRNVHSHSHGLQEYGVFPGNRGPARQSAATAHLQPSICYPSGSAEDLHPGHSSASLIKAIREELLRLSQKQAVVTSYHS
ncbi:UPF0606 protein KIAA1549 isoform X2 [Xenopus laevis]|uniref:UPF0606 protein KIAA1549 isoform X2 n=1 Tax=Xenopus laevis TaxID=8355 RepID=A0A8J1MQ11_XENLA|nr:UPF0606 protein KIAA1549 isoform X2 [Xenopus laevis]